MARQRGTGQEPFSQLEVVPSERSLADPEHFNAPSYYKPSSADAHRKEHPTILPEPTSSGSNRRKWLIGGVLTAVVIVAVVLGATLGTLLGHSKTHEPNPGSETPTGSAIPSMSGTATSLSIYSYPTAVSPYPGHVEVFALDASDSLYWKYKNTSTSSWMPQSNNLQNIPGLAASFEQGVTAVSRGESSIDIFVTGGDYRIYHKWHNPNSVNWVPNGSTWDSYGGGLTTTPSAISWSQDRLDIFALGDSPLYELFQLTYESNGGGWSEWIPIGGSWQVITPTAVTWGPGRIDVFVIDPNNKTLNHATGSGPNWPFNDLGGYCTSRPIAVTRGPGSLDVFARGGDASLWHLSYANGWDTWTPVDSKTIIQAEPEVVYCNIDSIELFAWRDDNALVHMTLDVTADADAKASSSSFSIVGQGLSGPPKAVCDGVNSVQVFVFLQNGEIGHRALDLQQKTWSPSSGFESLGKV